jgi:hypothetical protein
MRGLDLPAGRSIAQGGGSDCPSAGEGPHIYDEVPLEQTYNLHRLPRLIMDCRVKPGNDNGETVARGSGHRLTGSRFRAP